MLHDIRQDMPTDSSSNDPAGSGQLARQQAIKQIERKRRFWAGTVAAAVGMIVLVVIWATSEYHNAGGWPVDGFSQKLWHPRRVELLDHLPARRMGAADGGRRLVGLWA